MANHYAFFHTSLRVRYLWLFGLVLLVCSTTWAQVGRDTAPRLTLKGRVTDANGAGIPGVTIQIQGTTIGTVSDADGNYLFTPNVAAGPVTIRLTAVGYQPVTQSVMIGSQETLNVTMSEDVANLDEVVVTGSTIQTTRRELGNSISTIKGQALAQSGSGGLLNSLQGKVPGAQITQNSGDPAGGITVRLRGVKSLGGSSDPLYVIDGVIVSNASQNVSQLAVSDQVGGANPGTNRLADINPNDIATINVINGAAAAAQYGSRAINGVVLITTKRGQTGAPRVALNTSFNMNELRQGVPITTYGKQFGFPGLRLHPIGAVSATQIAANPGTTTVGILRDGTTAQLATNLVDVTRYNYFDQIFRTGTGTDNTLSVSGGRDNTQYYVSFGYLKNEGIIKGTDFRRYNLRARVDQRLTNWAKLSVGLSYINSFSNEKANGNVFYSPINSVTITNNIYDITLRDAAGNLQAVEPTRVNPLSTIEDMNFTQAVSRTINDVQLNLTPLPGLSIDAVVGVDSYSQLGNSFIRPYPYQAIAGLPLERYPNGFAATATNAVLQFNSDINATYQRDLTKTLNLKIIAGANYQYNQQDFTQSNGQNLVLPTLQSVSGAASTTVRAGYGLNRYNLSGVFGQATLGYRNLAFLTGAIRQDRATLFSPSETNQLYPKVSGSVVVSDLGFWKNASLSSFWNSAKIRASYGDAGGLTALGPSDRFYQYIPVGFLGRNTIIPSATLANPAVRPERMTEIEGGVDLSFFNDKVSLGVTAYSQRIKDLTVRRTLAASTGGTELVTNVGEMENKGLEVMLDVVPIKTKDFSWDLTFIYNQNRNKILALSSPRIEQSNVAGAPVFQIVGQPASVFFGTAYARNLVTGDILLTKDQGLPQTEKGDIYGPTTGKTAEQNLADAGLTPSTLPAGSYELAGTYYIPRRNADGQPVGSVLRKVIGNPNPKWTGSISSNLSYKALSLRFLVDFVQGVDVFNADKRTRENVGIGELTEQELKGTLTRGYIYAIGPIEEFRVDNGSFVKLREVALSYQLPQLVKGLSSLRLSLIGRNLISWDTYNGFDPETNAGGTSDLLRGIDFGNVPIPRTYQLQLSATF